ncbi:MAG: ABC transporter substrate-binding protein [Candidatus Odinarchaeota archaeon]
MESGTKRIVAIVLIAVIAVGVGVGVYFIVLTPSESVWSTPGVSGVSSDRMIKIGLMGDRGEIQGDQNYMGAYLAARTINEEGGVMVNSTRYYVAIASEDTDESAPDFSTPRAVTASERMVYKHKCQYAVGGFRTEALNAYRETFMDEKIPFLSTGAMTDSLCTVVTENYLRYKYYFRMSPYNSSHSSSLFTPTIVALFKQFNATYGPDDIDHMGILAENLAWTNSIRTKIPYVLNLPLGAYGGLGLGAGTVPSGAVIAFDPEVTPTIMNSYLSDLEALECDLVLIAISGGAGLTMTKQWKDHERNFVLFGSNVEAQTADYWERTNGACEFEIGSTTATRCNKTPHTIEVYDMFNTTFGEHPIYIGFAGYDAVNLIVSIINKTQSFNSDTFVADMETYTPSNPHHGGAGGDPTAWTSDHDLYAGYPFSYGIWFQWQDGVKTLIPSPTGSYPDTLDPMGSLEIPDWIDWTPV